MVLGIPVIVCQKPVVDFWRAYREYPSLCWHVDAVVINHTVCCWH